MENQAVNIASLSLSYRRLVQSFARSRRARQSKGGLWNLDSDQIYLNGTPLYSFTLIPEIWILQLHFLMIWPKELFLALHWPQGEQNEGNLSICSPTGRAGQLKEAFDFIDSMKIDIRQLFGELCRKLTGSVEMWSCRFGMVKE